MFIFYRYILTGYKNWIAVKLIYWGKGYCFLDELNVNIFQEISDISASYNLHDSLWPFDFYLYANFNFLRNCRAYLDNFTNIGIQKHYKYLHNHSYIETLNFHVFIQR